MEALRKAEAAVPMATPDAVSNGALKNARRQLESLGAARAFIGETEGAIAAFDLRDLPRGERRPMPADEIKAIDDGTVEDAIEAIVASARTKRVVLINEAHHVPMHRAFAHKLAIELRKIGYTYLAAETFSHPEEGRTMKGYVNVGFGTYTADPVYADFVNRRWRTAGRLSRTSTRHTA